MKLKVITSKREYEAKLEWIDKTFDKKVSPTSDEGEKLKVMLILIKEYEDRHYPVPPPDPIEAIKLKMEEKGIRNKDLVGKVGTKGYVSAILSRRKPLTLQLAKIFHHELGIPAEVLLSEEV
ncbi:MAG: transcriptional regulator [Chitinophagaceae bacterium]|nr:transcriptional regulator [Chitinophagaceae bacterium]